MANKSRHRMNTLVSELIWYMKNLNEKWKLNMEENEDNCFIRPKKLERTCNFSNAVPEIKNYL